MLQWSDIHERIPVADLVAAYPAAVTFLASRRLHCIVCGEPVWGTLEELATDKHFSREEIAALVEELRAFIADIQESNP